MKIFKSFFIYFIYGLFFLSQAYSQEAPQQFEGFNLQGYTDSGEKSWDVKGDTADILGNIIKINNVDANRYGDEQVNLKAKHGVFDRSSGHIHLENNVIITAQSGAQLKTNSLDWEKDKDLVTTDAPVTITDKGMVANGIGLKAQPGLKTAQMNKDVTITVNPEPEKKDSQTVTITSDGPVEIDQKFNKAIFNKNVVAVQNDRTLKADLVEVYFDPETKQIKQMICTGHVLIIQGGNSSLSDKAVYNADDQKLILTGRPKLIMVTQGSGGIASFQKKEDESKTK